MEQRPREGCRLFPPPPVLWGRFCPAPPPPEPAITRPARHFHYTADCGAPYVDQLHVHFLLSQGSECVLSLTLASTYHSSWATTPIFLKSSGDREGFATVQGTDTDATKNGFRSAKSEYVIPFATSWKNLFAPL